ncbi:28421_t:CDS:2 [Gigaspora margarita]|uniref:28421_t:CDS:1 n=1 Tax=Gigaspora margarita TaxID=4874 RepID=A0ABN7VQ91_GIGMA|nr:28421_t:CDS:2 [Gigaspora margarita]
MVENVSNSKVLVAESSLKRRDQEVKDDDKVLKRTKAIDRAENIDDGEANLDYNDNDYSNCDIDPNIELLEEQIPVQSHLKYPDKDSPDNFWVLPSGKSVDTIIHAPKNLHKSHPLCLEIIHIGSKIRKPEWIKQKD